MEKSFLDIFNEFNKLKLINNNKLIKCTVLSINKNSVLVDSGLKSESIIPIEEFYDDYNKINLNIGDIIEVFLDTIENGRGKTILSMRKAKIYKSWLNLENYYINNKIINGKIIEKVKGGFIVLIDNIKSFLPGSLIDFRSMNSNNLEGKELDFKIIKLDKINNNIIISRKAVIDIENYNDKKYFLDNLKKDDIIKGIVKNITDYGIFVDLGFIDGLIHITDITWKRIKHPSEVVNIGNEINVKVLNFDKNNLRISLGLKQLTKDPWENILKKYPKFSKVSGIITNITDYGFFVEIESGIEGLVHISEIYYKDKLYIDNNIKIKEKIDVIILDINEDNRRISLGLKQQFKLDNWKYFISKNNIGNKILGKIKSITDFGIFIELENNFNGLIHISEFSNINFYKYYLKIYNKDDEIISEILDIDNNKFRVSLSIKNIIEDNFKKYINENKINDLVFGIIKFIDYTDLIVCLYDNVLGKCSINKNNNIKINSKFKFKIINYDYNEKLINLELV